MEIVQLNSNANLSEHFLLGEFTRSKYPEVYNNPSHEVISHLKNLCHEPYQQRGEYGGQKGGAGGHAYRKIQYFSNCTTKLVKIY